MAKFGKEGKNLVGVGVLLVIIVLAFSIGGEEESSDIIGDNSDVVDGGSDSVGEVDNGSDVIEENECTSDSDCVPAGCCHPSSCVSADNAPICGRVFCTSECQEGTLDCGQGSCQCINNKCAVTLNQE